MKNILIIGASGNVGSSVLRFLPVHSVKIWRGSRSVTKPDEERFFDFYHLNESARSLDGIDVLFLLRPPEITDMKRVFNPLIQICQQRRVKHIVFLSVQGAESSTIIPHRKIELAIERSGIAYTFIRPSYFMQNLTTTLLPEIRKSSSITLPAGNAKFLWVDLDDVGRAAAIVLANSEQHERKAYTITGSEHLIFQHVCLALSKAIGREIQYRNVGLFSFYFQKRREGFQSNHIIVLIALHYIARFQSPKISNDFKMITGLQPGTLNNFLLRHREVFVG